MFMRQALRNFIAAFIFIVLFLIGCEGNPLIEKIHTQENKLTEPTLTVDQLQSDLNSKETETVEPVSGVSDQIALTIWVPAQFLPSSDSDQAKSFYQRLQDFKGENPQVEINVRVKASNGQGNLLNSLINTSLVAQGAKPSLIILSRTDMQIAVERGVIYPIVDYSTVIGSLDWYQYARELAMIKGVTYGLPFVGDALAIIANPKIIDEDVTTWLDLREQSAPLYFPAADSQALVLIALYQSAGGKINDQQGQPIIQTDILEKTLEEFALGVSKGIFSSDMVNYQLDKQTWQLFQDGQADWVITWITNYLESDGSAQKVIQLPSIGPESYALSRGWIWCLSESDPEKAKWSARLAEYLTERDFLASWTYTAGFLPVRPSSMSEWKDQSSLNAINKILLDAHIGPEMGLTENITPVLRESLGNILEQRMDPELAAQTAIQQWEETQTE